MTHKRGSNPPPPPGAVKPPPPGPPSPRSFVPVAYPDGSYGRGLPILRNHDPAAVIGVFSFHAGRTVAEFKPGAIPLEVLVGIGGGWRVLETEQDGPYPYRTFVRRAELLELSTVTISRNQAQEGHMSATKVQLGDRVKDRVTGFKGIAVAITEWLNGCRRVGVQAEKLAEGKPGEVQYFDEPQLEVLEHGVYKPFEPDPAPTPAPAAAGRRGGPRQDPSARRDGE